MQIVFKIECTPGVHARTHTHTHTHTRTRTHTHTQTHTMPPITGGQPRGQHLEVALPLGLFVSLIPPVKNAGQCSTRSLCVGVGLGGWIGWLMWGGGVDVRVWGGGGGVRVWGDWVSNPFTSYSAWTCAVYPTVKDSA